MDNEELKTPQTGEVQNQAAETIKTDEKENKDEKGEKTQAETQKMVSLLEGCLLDRRQNNFTCKTFGTYRKVQ